MRSQKTLALFAVGAALLFCVSLAAAQGTNTGVPAPPSARPSKALTASAGVSVDLSPGTGAPPTTLGGMTMTKVPPGAPSCTGVNPPGPISTPGGGITVVPWVGQRCIGAGWSTWSHGYRGDVYFTGAGVLAQTITLPAGTKAFYFYVEPNAFGTFGCQAVSGSTSTGVFQVQGDSGAKYVGFFATGGDTLQSIRVSCDSAANGFATGEYGWATGGGPSPWGAAYVTLFDTPSDLDLLRQYRDEVLTTTAKGKLYATLLYENSDEALDVLLDNPRLLYKAKNLIEANMDAVLAVLDGSTGVIYNTNEIISFLDAYARKSPRSLRFLVSTVKRSMLQSQRRGTLFLGFRLE